MPKLISTRTIELNIEGLTRSNSKNPWACGEFLEQENFVRMLGMERKRSERSGRRFALMILQSSLLAEDSSKSPLGRALEAIRSSVRETDFQGWYQEGSAIGIVFTELGSAPTAHVVEALRAKITNALCASLDTEQTDRISLSIHVFPDGANEEGPTGPMDAALYPDVINDSSTPLTSGKRFMDVAGSMLAILAFSPVLAAIAVSIKLTSKGPVVFRQVRVGRDGRRFTFLKFRSMYEANNNKIHEEYVRRLIGGSLEGQKEAGKVFKLTDDPRITPLGKFLRKTSLDELPQLVNVFRGDMSLVGPRPPVPYEYECYKVWHRGRLLGVKPGLTGLWQVGGRSRVGFNEMVRLDLKYAKTRSVWLDLKILVRTPAAVLTGDGAY
jgi:lipopolysaccharide/colanic/teichoic acid biosynthesis glycosyltransferase